MAEDTKSEGNDRRHFLKGLALSSAALGAAATGLFAGVEGKAGLGVSQVHAADAPKLKYAFIQWQPNQVSSAWSQGIAEVIGIQDGADYQLLDGQAKVDVQLTLMDTAISSGINVIFLQPGDSVAVGSSIKKAKRAGIPVITLNIDATEPHAAHVEMNHYFGAIQIAKTLGDAMGGKGKVAILNAPPGIIIRDMRTNGFKDGLKKFHPDIQIVADQVADWDRKKAQDVFSTILTANPDVTGVYGVSDTMAMGAVDVLKAKNMIGKVSVFGNDGEKDALEAIEAGELTGTQYTDVFQQGRFAAASAIVLASGGVPADAFARQGHLLMPYVIATKETVGSIQSSARW